MERSETKEPIYINKDTAVPVDLTTSPPTNGIRTPGDAATSPTSSPAHLHFELLAHPSIGRVRAPRGTPPPPKLY